MPGGRRTSAAGKRPAGEIGFSAVRVAGIATALAGRRRTAEIYLDCIGLARRGSLARPFLATSINGQVMYEAMRSPAVRREFNRFDMTSMDGQPPVLASRLWPKGFEERVATTDLLHDVIEAGLREQVAHYLFGAHPEIVAEAADALRRRHPGLKIAGFHHGYIADHELPLVAADIERSGAEVVWICMGVPREQQFACELARLAPRVAVIKTGGGLLDFASGRRARAPRWLQAMGLEWAFRVWLEPRRLLGRYLISNPVALAYLFATLFRPPAAQTIRPSGLIKGSSLTPRRASC